MRDIMRARSGHLRLGRRGERLACAYFAEKGFDILLRNYRDKRGEIDIICRDGDVLCFVEVKTRRTRGAGRPAEGLSPRQARRICNAGAKYLSDIGHPGVVYRFDLIEVVVGDWDVRELRHWKDHFSPSASCMS